MDTSWNNMNGFFFSLFIPAGIECDSIKTNRECLQAGRLRYNQFPLTPLLTFTDLQGRNQENNLMDNAGKMPAPPWPPHPRPLLHNGRGEKNHLTHR